MLTYFRALSASELIHAQCNLIDVSDDEQQTHGEAATVDSSPIFNSVRSPKVVITVHKIRHTIRATSCLRGPSKPNDTGTRF